MAKQIQVVLNVNDVAEHADFLQVNHDIYGRGLLAGCDSFRYRGNEKAPTN